MKDTIESPRVVGMQMDLAWEDAPANCRHAEALLNERPPSAGSLVVLPEMFSSGFSMNPSSAAEPAGGATEQWLSASARRFGVWMIAGLARRDAAIANAQAGNDALVLDPQGKLVACYRKQRPFSPGGEHMHYSPGEEGLVFSWQGLGVSPFICYDLRFPELFRKIARNRPEVFVVIASWPDKRIAHWIKLLQARAIENQAFVVGVNRVGTDPSHQYPGRSMIVNPWGEILAEAGEREAMVEAELDLPSLRDYRKKLPFLEDLKS